MTCPTETKVPYLTVRDAARAAVDMLKVYGPQRPYPCDCGRYHLTTKPMAGVAGPLTADQVKALAKALDIL